jgi:opacity protein-like surface antigen
MKRAYLTIVLAAMAAAPVYGADIIHDADHYILEAQHGTKWMVGDKEIDAKLADIRRKNGGKRPNIIYILIDDVGFGELGMPELNLVRGYRTPAINKFATEGKGNLPISKKRSR